MAPSDKKKETRAIKDGGIGTALREYAPFLTLGFQLAAAVVIFFLIGVWLDDRLGTSPLFTLLGLLLGSAGGFIKFFRSVSELEKKKNLKKD